MFLCCRWWNSCRTSFDSSPRVCRWFPSRLSTCPRSHKTGLSSAWLTICVNRRQRNSWWKCVRSYPVLIYSGNVEQNVDIPVPHSRGGRGGLQDLRPGQDSTAFCGADHVDNPVPLVGRLQGFLPRQTSAASSSHSPDAADEVFTVFFFFAFPAPSLPPLSPSSTPKKRRGWVPTHGRNWPRTRAQPRSELMACPWRSRRTSRSQRRSRSWRLREKSTLADDCGNSWVLVHSVNGPFRRNITKKRSQWYSPWWRGFQ